MTPSREIRNPAASVHQRLLSLARERGTDFNLVLQRYLAERFLYRLGVSGEVDHFTLKGAALFRVWTGGEFRPTRDLDLLGADPADRAAIRAAIGTICGIPCPEDGLVLDPATIGIEDLRDQQEHGGVRVRIPARLGGAQLSLQVDIGFGDVVTPDREVADYPTLLDQPAPRVWIYPRETFVAEKFETMVQLGPANSRVRDLWDVAALALGFPFDGETLRAAIGETFRQRRTPLTAALPEALRPAYYRDAVRIRHWQAFLARLGSEMGVPATLEATGEMLRRFLGPVAESLGRNELYTRVWPAGGPWRAGAG
jgi:hypothetical protein